MHSDESPTTEPSATPTSPDHASPDNLAMAPSEDGLTETVSAAVAIPNDDIPATQAQFLQWTQAQLQSLQQQRDALEAEVAQLERRKARIESEMQTTFAGSSEEVAVRVQSFKEYLVGSLQDLVVAADRLELVRQVEVPMATATPETASQPKPSNTFEVSDLTFAEPNYQQKNDRIRQVLTLFQNEPDYYGPPWKLRP
ncbi:MAG: DUF3086 domain-containing protein, partial [Alkalinema sp. RL_2_19]|nr:DUF3086 domain-containing protein [Alkalinema sp. RL_2_19]